MSTDIASAATYALFISLAVLVVCFSAAVRIAWRDWRDGLDAEIAQRFGGDQ